MGPLTRSKQRHSQRLEDMNLLRGLQSPEQAERVAIAQGGCHPIVSKGHSQLFSKHIRSHSLQAGRGVAAPLYSIKGGGPCTAPANINDKVVVRRSVVNYIP